MVVFPNCKINLGLRVLERRQDGYHNIETVFFPIPLRDALEVIAEEDTPRKHTGEEFQLTSSGLTVPCDDVENLCRKAWLLIKNDHPNIPPLHFYLHKNIPTGAGLGGGSADGAFSLLLLNRLLDLHLSAESLYEYALRLGSDCPFFILNKPCIATGRGEQITEIDMKIDDYYVVLADCGVHVNTAWAFSQLHVDRNHLQTSVRETISKPVESWRGELINDFEIPVFTKYPQLKAMKEAFYQTGAVYASLTGTGGCIFGIFHRNTDADTIKLPAGCRIFNLNPVQ